MTAVLLYTLGVIAFAIALGLSIGLHELGHLVPAKVFGCKVTQYFVGFGPTVWSRRTGETEVGLKAFPLGGYVKIVGMLPPSAQDLVAGTEVDEDGNEVHRIRRSNTGMFTQLIADARAAEWDLIGPEDEDRLFYKRPWWQKVVVMSGGPMVNLLIAFVMFWGLFGLYGVHSIEAAPGQPQVHAVVKCVLPWDSPTTECSPEDPVAPAYQAGLRPGDVITGFNGTPVTDWDQFRTLIRSNADGRAVIEYERDGRVRTGVTSTTVQARPTSETDTTLVQVGFLGVEPTTREVVTRGGPVFTLVEMGHMTARVADVIVTLPAKVWDVGQAIVGLEERAADSPVSVVGGGRFAGEIASHEQLDVASKVAAWTSIVAGFNLFIGLLNFVPLLPLDGGHVAGALWEAVRRGFARLRGRPDPGYVDVAKLLPVAYVVALGLLVMGVVLIIGDIVVPVRLTG